MSHNTDTLQAGWMQRQGCINSNPAWRITRPVETLSRKIREFEGDAARQEPQP